MIALLGKHDTPTDGIDDYCKFLGHALAPHGVTLDRVHVPWNEEGWIGALRRLSRDSADWRGQWVLVQYTALSWSRRGFPWGVLAAVAILRRNGARCAVVFHEHTGFGGASWRERVRHACQMWVLRRLFRKSERNVFTVPLGSVGWLTPARAGADTAGDRNKAVFIPIGANLPVGSNRADDGARNRRPGREKTAVVFGVRYAPSAAAEVADIAAIVREASKTTPNLRLIVLGRGSSEVREDLQSALEGSAVKLDVRGVMPAEEIAHEIQRADALLFVRSPVTLQRGGAMAGIACGVPIVGYGGAEPGVPLAEAGIEWAPWRDREALAQGLIRVLTDAERSAELRERNARVQERYFSWNRIAELFLTNLTDRPTGAGSLDPAIDAPTSSERSERQDARKRRPFRALYVATHPIQYGVPIFRQLASDPRLELTVAYCSLQGAESAIDPDFGVEVKWDVPLLDGYRWVHVPNRAPNPRVGAFYGLVNPGLWKLVRAGDYDAIITHIGYNHLSYWILLAAAKVYGTPLIFVTDTSSERPFDPSKWKRMIKPLVAPALFRLNSVIAAGSSVGYELFRSMGIPEERIVLAPFVVDNAWWTEQAEKVDRRAVREEWGVPEHSPVILFCAKLQPRKRPLDLLRAFARSGVADAHLVFAGDGPLAAELEREAAELGIRDRVHFRGFQNQSQMPGNYCAADLLALPSDFDPCPVVVCEAMVCGVPVVLSDEARGRLELIENGKTGYIFHCGDIDGLAEILRTALADRPRLAMMGEAAARRMRTWSPREHLEGLIQGLTRVAAAPEPERPSRLLIVGTHFVQYTSPVFGRLSKDPRIDLLVAYCSRHGAEVNMDPEFGVALAWDTPVNKGFPHVVVPNRSLRPGLGRFWGCFNPGMWRLVRDGKFDAVYVTGYYVASQWIAMLAAKYYGVPLILSTDAHAIESRHTRTPLGLAAKRRIVHRIFAMADVVLGMSSGSVEYVRSVSGDQGRNGRIHLLRYVVDNDWWREQAAAADRRAVRARWGIPADAGVVLFCGKLQEWKRPNDLLQAFAAAAVSGSYLVFAGTGPLAPMLESRANELGIGGRVRFLGFVNQTALPGTYVASDLLVLPSGYEPFGLVVNEAMVCGRPVAVSDSVGAGRDLVRDSETGFVYRTGDVESLASILRHALSNGELLERMGTAARDRMETWSPREFVEDIVAAVDVGRARYAGAARGVRS
jgi:glycosyltransferase involved in cell wall biosynthesis